MKIITRQTRQKKQIVINKNINQNKTIEKRNKD